MPAGNPDLHIASANPIVRFNVGDRQIETAKTVTLPPVFVDRCRQAFHSIRFDGDSRVLGVTSARRGDGKTSIAIGLATAIASDTGEPTILVECDLERACFARIFEIAASPGLAEWVDGEQPLHGALMSPTDNSYVVAGGGAVEDSTRVLYKMSQSMLVDALQAHFKNVILDLPPMLTASYGQLGAKLAGRILLVARHGVTSMPDLEEAVEVAGVERIAGLVLNACSAKRPGRLRRVGAPG